MVKVEPSDTPWPDRKFKFKLPSMSNMVPVATLFPFNIFFILLTCCNQELFSPQPAETDLDSKLGAGTIAVLTLSTFSPSKFALRIKKRCFELGHSKIGLAQKTGINRNSLQNYEYLLHNKNWIPCANQIGDIDDFEWSNWLERLAIERLENKSASVTEILESTLMDWEMAFFISISGYFGQKINES